MNPVILAAAMLLGFPRCDPVNVFADRTCIWPVVGTISFKPNGQEKITPYGFVLCRLGRCTDILHDVPPVQFKPREGVQRHDGR